MKAYILTEADFDRLLTFIHQDPLFGASGGSLDASVRDPVENRAHEKAGRFYNYQVRKWISEVQK